MRCLTVRRLVTMLLCLTMIFLLTACGGQGEPNADDGGVSATGKISGGKDRASVPEAGSEKAEAALALLRKTWREMSSWPARWLISAIGSRGILSR